MPNFCPSCGAKVNEGFKFCLSCGAQLQPEDTAGASSFEEQAAQTPSTGVTAPVPQSQQPVPPPVTPG